MKERIDNLRRMERILNEMNDSVQMLNKACEAWEKLFPEYRELYDYYGSEQWHADRESFDLKHFPEREPCGVLSEDAVYNLIFEQRETALYIAKTALKALEY